jgi:thymidylate synthase
MYFDCREGFPIVTTKHVNFNAVVAELIGFLRGANSAAVFRDLGTKIWDANANETASWLANPFRKGKDDLGQIYGVQWRSWLLRSGTGHIDQIGAVLNTINDDPDSRRILVSAWNVSELHLMALPPCHVLWQVLPDKTTREMDLCVYLRSWDLFLGGPFNIASYGLLLNLLCLATGYKARWLNVFAADVHIYENHLEQVKTQVERGLLNLPTLTVNPQPLTDGISPQRALEWLTCDLEPDHIRLENYMCHPPIKAPMAA